MLNKLHEKQQGMELIIHRLLIHPQAVRAAVQRQPGPSGD